MVRKKKKIIPVFSYTVIILTFPCFEKLYILKEQFVEKKKICSSKNKKQDKTEKLRISY